MADMHRDWPSEDEITYIKAQMVSDSMELRSIIQRASKARPLDPKNNRHRRSLQIQGQEHRPEAGLVQQASKEPTALEYPHPALIEFVKRFKKDGWQIKDLGPEEENVTI